MLLIFSIFTHCLYAQKSNFNVSIEKRKSRLMENSQDQPPPPGVHSSWPYYSSNTAQTLQYQFPPNAGSNNTPYYNYQQGTLPHPGFITYQQPLIPSAAPPTVQSTSSNHVDGRHHNAENTTSAASQESGANYTWKVDEGAAVNSVVQLSNARDIDAAAQDAVLREQVCIPCI